MDKCAESIIVKEEIRRQEIRRIQNVRKVVGSLTSVWWERAKKK